MELEPTGIAHGGEAIARVDGKAHFVAGAMPGETVEGRVVRDKKSWARVELVRVLEASPDRVAPPCPHFDECGGCQWQYAAYPAQKRWKQSIVEGQLRHLGGIDEPPVLPTVAAGAPYGYRNRMDFVVDRGRLSLRRRRSRSAVPIRQCLLMEPALAAVFERIGDVSGADSLTLRVGVATGETLAVVRGGLPAGYEEWGCGVVHDDGETLQPVIGPGAVNEEVAGHRFRITGDTFFQNSTAGAAALAGLVAEALDPGPDDTLLDGYAGGGLFGVVVGSEAGSVIAVEESLQAAVDLNANFRTAGIEPRVFNLDFASAAEIRLPWDLAVVDPPRKGLGADGVAAVTSPGPRAIAYVSCDPASLGRDARLLVEAGYRLEAAVPVDQFPQTFHVETVATFRRR
jgi:23S rRNA (uracil1939-C5)-methyltransferase